MLSANAENLVYAACVFGAIGLSLWGYWVGKMDERDRWKKELTRRGVLFEQRDPEKKALYWRNGGEKVQ